MDIYIEDAIFDTTIINFEILFLTKFSLKEKFNFLKILLSSLLGCVCSLIFTFFDISIFFLILSKLLVGIIMTVIIIDKLNFKLFLLTYLIFLSYTFLLGGFCFFIIYLFGGEIYSITNLTYNLPISLGVITFLLGIYVWFVVLLIKQFYKKQKIESFCFELEIVFNNKKQKIKAYLDSGNLLKEDKSNLPVIILDLKLFLKIFDDKISLIDVLNGKLDHIIYGGKYINFNSVGKNGKLFVFPPDKIFIKDKNKIKEINALVGVSFSKSFSNNFDALIGPLCFDL